mmetsp:Transcript_86250/g.276860  ORF Transcript_86250/g.276860 Transcript_86250/m.276860 type:complete len:1399 (+) Transcript_86250:77-4273(+)
MAPMMAFQQEASPILPDSQARSRMHEHRKHAAMLRSLLGKHLFVAWRRRRWYGALFPTLLYGGLICAGWRLLQESDLGEVSQILVAYMAPAYLLLGMASHLQLSAVDIVSEKETKLKVMQEITGLPSSVYWLSWFLYFMLIGIVCSLLTIFLTAFASGIFQHSNLLLVFSIFLLSYAQIFATACVLSVICDRAETAGRVSQFAFGGLMLLAGCANGFMRRAGLGFFYAISLAPVVSIYTSLSSTMWLELSGAGLTMQTLASNCCAPHVPKGSASFFPVGSSMIMLALDTCLYFALAWWLDQIWQSEHGTAKASCFCVDLSRFCKCCQSVFRTSGRVLGPARDIALLDVHGRSSGSQGIAISIQELVKTFNTTCVVDVSSLDVLTGEIFAVLGHNGAGKTTLLNCLVGLTPPTSGTAFVNGYSVLDQMARARGELGLCPQDNPLWEEFTVDRHLRLFAAIRGMSDASEDIVSLLKALGLIDKQHALGKTLSGGQKRRLWVVTAMLGDAPVLILDEPTSGMDPCSRRELWDLLLKKRGAGRCIVFTTHYLEEADILADRKAVLARGKIQAVGTSRELKLRFGVGYRLEVELCNLSAEGVSAGKREGLVSSVGQLVQRHVPRAVVCEDEHSAVASGGRDISSSRTSRRVRACFQLPFGDIDAFGPMLTELETRRDEFGLMDFALQMTSLEEVFMRLGEEAETNTDTTAGVADVDVPDATSSAAPVLPPVGFVAAEAGHRSELRSALGLVRVRFQCLARNKARVYQQVVLPLLLLASAFFSGKGEDGADLSEVLNVPVAFSMLTIGFAVTVLADRESKCKFVALSQGMPVSAYWCGTLMADYLLSLPAVVAVPLMIVCSRRKDIETSALPLLILECMFYPLPLIVFSYYASSWFSTRESLVKFFPLANLLFGTIPSIVVLLLRSAGSVGLHTMADAIHRTMSFCNPIYGLPGVLIYIPSVGRGSGSPPAVVADYFRSSAALPLFLAPLATLLLALRLLWREGRVAAQGCHEGSLASVRADDETSDQEEGSFGDQDVVGEAQRIRFAFLEEEETSSSACDAIMCCDLQHSYAASSKSAQPVRAVRGITLGIKQGECFGLLGPNGAGKTTTLALLTGELWPPNSGEVFVGGRGISTARHGFFELLYGHLGICPQVDPLWPELTGRAHLLFHGRIKGVPEAFLFSEVESILQQLGFSAADADKQAKTYSGGMKRKLSLALALIGRPSLLLLDEPSAGVDAVAKRSLWSLIRGRTRGQTVLLTTHSMEEADALCDRLAIQVAGKLRCLGSPIHIKHRYGKGYQLELFVATSLSAAEDDEDPLVAVRSFVAARISPEAVLVQSQHGRCLFQLPPTRPGHGPGLGNVLTEVAQARRELGISEYSLCQPTLEQVFLRFARLQEQSPQDR